MFNFNKKTIDKDAQYIIDIVEKYSNDENIKKLISPISDEYYLIDSKNEVYICIGDEKITLSNHAFLYKKIFNLSFTNKLKKQIKNNIEQEMQLLKQSLFKNETDLLLNILNFSNKKNTHQVIKPIFKAL